MYESKAYSAASETSPLAISKIPRRDPTERDVQIEILFCGICHSDLHAVRNEWSEFMPTVYPIVPGHEIVAAFSLIGGRHSLSGSAIGGIRETQEMLDFCGEHNITADVEVIPIQKLNEAYDRMARSDVKYRFSIDMASLRDE